MLTKNLISSFFLIYCLSTAVDSTALTIATHSCQDAIPVGLGAVRETHGHDVFESRLFTVWVAAPGQLLLDVAALDPHGVEPRIGSFGKICDRAGETQHQLEAYITGLVVAIDRPGQYFFRIAAQDPAAPMADYVIRSRFASRSIAADKDIEEPEEDPDLIPDKEIEEPEEDPDLRIGSKPAWIGDLCQSGNSQDQGDVFTCATPIAFGQEIDGEIRHRHAEDADVFSFSLETFRTVEILATAENRLTASLHDLRGHRMALSDPGHDLRLTRTLGPGRYFLRLSGDQAAEGLYRLRLEASDW